jgi:hypothetical protein
LLSRFTDAGTATFSTSHDLETPSPFPAVDTKIRIEREYPRFFKDFSASDQANIGEGRWTIPVFLQERLETSPILSNPDGDFVNAFPAQRDHLGGPASVNLPHEKT